MCLAGAVAAKLYLGTSTQSKMEEMEESPKTQIAGNNNFFGEEDISDK
jgi:hypothetical protein